MTEGRERSIEFMEFCEQAIGLERALHFVESYSEGREMRVPQPNDVHMGHKLVTTFGRDTALALCRRFAGTYEVIPSGCHLRDKLRRQSGA